MTYIENFGSRTNKYNVKNNDGKRNGAIFFNYTLEHLEIMLSCS